MRFIEIPPKAPFSTRVLTFETQEVVVKSQWATDKIGVAESSGDG